MADDSNNNANSPTPSRNRRSSFAGETFANLFGNGRANSISRGTGNNEPSQPTQQYPGAIATAAAQAQRRRLSLTTLGLSGSPNQTSPFNSYRRDSSVSANSGSIDESAIEEDTTAGPTPQTPFARRVSFGAKALRDVRTSVGGSGGGGGTDQNGISKPTPSDLNLSNGKNHGSISSRGENNAKGREGFNWSDNLRTRAERTSLTGMAGNGPSPPSHARAKSVAIMEAPIKEMPKPKEQVRPDHFQERILKGDFYMD